MERAVDVDAIHHDHIDLDLTESIVLGDHHPLRHGIERIPSGYRGRTGRIAINYLWHFGIPAPP